jgi:hypothetical protein
MTRAASLALFVVAAVGLARGSARTDLPPAPAPREVRPDGTRPPAPPPEPPAKAEDPAAVVDRIIKNSTAVGDKLAKSDTGTNTRDTQNKILKDIEALINRQDDPPPPKPDDNKDKDKDKNKDMNKDPMKNPDMSPKGDDMPKGGEPPTDGMGKGDKPDGMPKDGMGKGDKPDGMPKDGMGKGDKPGMGNKADGMPMGGGTETNESPKGKGERRPRAGEPKKDHGDAKQEPMGEQKQEPMGGDQKGGGGSKEPKGPNASGGSQGGKTVPKGSLPFDDDVAKEVWGHLPPKLRQQMAQYYKEDMMPKYAELLRLYYSSLSDKAAPAVPPPQPK